MKPWLLVIVVVLCILVVVALALFLRYWRSKQQHRYHNGETGLPYHIELDEEDFSIDQFERE
jgi:hypothetical protein